MDPGFRRDAGLERPGGHCEIQVWVSGRWTTRPSISGETTSWQLSRLLGLRGLAVPSSIASSSGCIGGVPAHLSPCPYTRHGAPPDEPPRSATMTPDPL